jgi:iron-sulfur cluster repair protein YtfE (RIC family)
MDIIDVFLERHGELRARISELEAPFKRPHGVGWDDLVTLDCQRMQRDIGAFFEAFREHEASEDAMFAEAADRIRLDPATREAFEKGRRAVADIMKLFGAVAFTCDGEHVHRVRELLSRMREEVEAHLAYEEKVLFPLAREGLPAALLTELADRLLHGHSAR